MAAWTLAGIRSGEVGSLEPGQRKPLLLHWTLMGRGHGPRVSALAGAVA